MFLVIIAMIPALLHGIFNVGHLHYVANGMYPHFFDGFGPNWYMDWIHVLPIVIVSYDGGSWESNLPLHSFAAIR